MASPVSPAQPLPVVAPSAQTVSARWPWILLPGRLVLFLFFQALIAAGLNLTGAAAGWEPSGAWWPVTISLTNLACIVLLVRLFRREGNHYWDLFRFDRQHIKRDLLILLGFFIVSGPVAMLPNTLLAAALFGDSAIATRLLLAPLPAAGIVVALIVFPVTQGLVELAYYFRVIMPRLEKQINPWAAYALASLFLGLQHMAAPMRFDARFMLWRAVMFLPFALLIGAVLKWRPRLLPYVAIVHALMDFATGMMYLMPV